MKLDLRRIASLARTSAEPARIEKTKPEEEEKLEVLKQGKPARTPTGQPKQTGVKQQKQTPSVQEKKEESTPKSIEGNSRVELSKHASALLVLGAKKSAIYDKKVPAEDGGFSFAGGKVFTQYPDLSNHLISQNYKVIGVLREGIDRYFVYLKK